MPERWRSGAALPAPGGTLGGEDGVVAHRGADRAANDRRLGEGCRLADEHLVHQRRVHDEEKVTLAEGHAMQLLLEDRLGPGGERIVDETAQEGDEPQRLPGMHEGFGREQRVGRRRHAPSPVIGGRS